MKIELEKEQVDAILYALKGFISGLWDEEMIQKYENIVEVLEIVEGDNER